MVSRRPIVCMAVSMVLAFACGNGGAPTANAGDGSEGGTPDAGADASQPQCDDGFMPFRWTAVPAVADEQCVDTTSPEVIELCLKPEPLGWWRYHCYRRLEDGREYWLAMESVNHPDRRSWELCDIEHVSQDPHPPPPCFAARCPDPEPASQPRILSTCNEEITRRQFNCGGDGGNDVWDEDCCLRVRCATDADCPSGRQCRDAIQHSLIYCWIPMRKTDTEWVFAEDACGCAGSFGGPPARFCF